MDLQLRDLKYFETVATLGHMGKAGEKLGRTQPALTKSIQRLEQAFGSALFERDGRGIRLTPVGEVLLARARLLRASADETIREVSDFAQGHGGHVRIGTGPIAADDVLPEICSLLLSQVKDVTMEITVAPSTALREQLRHGQIDLLMGLMPEPDDEFLCHPIVDDVVVVAATASHPVFSLPKVTMRALLAYSWVLPTASIPSRQWLDAAFESRSLPRPRVRIEANSIPLLPRLIARTRPAEFCVTPHDGAGPATRSERSGAEGDDAHPEAGRQPAPRGLFVSCRPAAAGTAALTRGRAIFQSQPARLSLYTAQAQKCRAAGCFCPRY
ncbi:LysR family transcriptional regulator [Polaromonas sp. P2-4]|nr:LysR family transcriptional regulator [Polaromonas sp. P2-4]